MDLELLNVVVLCENFEKQVAWYKDILDLEVTLKEEGDYHYTELSKGKQCIVGLASAKEMDHLPTSKRNNSTFLQIKVKGIKDFFERVKQSEGKIIFGVNKEEKHDFLYGSIADPEGNEIWVIDEMD